MWLACSHAVCPLTNHLVEGRPLPDHVAGHLALELCNTKALWGLPTEREYLHEFTDLALWAREHSVLSPAETRAVRGALLTDRQRVAALRQVQALRAALFATVTGTVTATDQRRSSADEVHRFVARAVSRAAYLPTPDGRLELVVPLGPTAIVDRLALAAHRLLEDYGPDAVGLCASQACGWVFLDQAHRRRWCSMAVCGNRAKARRFVQRQRAGGTVRAVP